MHLTFLSDSVGTYSGPKGTGLTACTYTCACRSDIVLLVMSIHVHVPCILISLSYGTPNHCLKSSSLPLIQSTIRYWPPQQCMCHTLAPVIALNVMVTVSNTLCGVCVSKCVSCFPCTLQPTSLSLAPFHVHVYS